MENTQFHPMAQAKVQVRGMSTNVWRDSLDFDPVTIPVEQRVSGFAHSTDAYNSTVIALVSGIIEADTSSDTPFPSLEYRLVWSNTGNLVYALCPVCDGVFIVSEGSPGDELNEGVDAVFCGCDPRDSFNG